MITPIGPALLAKSCMVRLEPSDLPAVRESKEHQDHPSWTVFFALHAFFRGFTPD
jgi:hypothetical protein